MFSTPAAIPSLLNPIRLIIAFWGISRNRRGFSLPGCGRGVSVPTSTKPNPAWPKALTVSASLSIPAASPTRLRNFIPRISTGSEGTSPITRGSTRIFSARRNPHKVTLWAVSGFIWNNTLLAAEYKAGDTMRGVYHTLF